MPNELELIVAPAPEVVVEVTATDPPVVQLTTTTPPNIVTLYSVGPQGATLQSLGDVPDVNTTAKIDRSLLYYDAASAQFRADATITKNTLTDGGNY